MVGVLGALLLVDPWGAGAFDDDWTYAAITRHLAETGSFALNGWIATMLGFQAWVGVGFIRAFGSSAEVLRVATLTLHLLGVLAAYRIAVRAGARPSLAAFVGAAIGLSPVAIPLSLSFMTDVPALAMCLICVDLSGSAWARAGAGDRAAALARLLVSAAVGFAAGTIRQVAWLVPVATLALFLLDHRRDRRLAAGAALAGLVVALAAWLTLRWFEGLPLSYALVARGRSELMRHPLRVAAMFTRGALTTAILVAPASWTLLRWWWPRRPAVSAARLGAVLLLVAITAGARPDLLAPPWLGNTLLPAGVLGDCTCLGTRGELLARWVRAVVMLLALAPWVLWAARRSGSPSRGGPGEHPAGRRPVLAALAGLVLGTSLHVVISNQLFDRYLLPIAALAMIAMLTHRRAWSAQRPHGAGWAALLVLAGYGVVTAHDYFALLRARHRAVELTLAAGVERRNLYAGYELDGPFQLERAGHVDGAVAPLQVPHAGCPTPSPFAERASSLRLTPHIQPTHFIVTSLQDWLDPSFVLEVEVAHWFPGPVHSIWVQKLAEPRSPER